MMASRTKLLLPFIVLLIFHSLNWQRITSDNSSSTIQLNPTIALDSDEFHALIDYVTNLVYNERYKGARETCEKIIDCYPESPAGYFYMAALYQTIMRNYRVKIFEPEFERYVRLAIEKGKIAIEENAKDAFSYFYLGKAYGYKSLHKIGKHERFGAFRDGLKGFSYLKKAVKVAPNLYDAYCGIGIYHYWRSAKSRAFWFLPFIGDDRQKGIDELWLAINKGKHSEIEGKYSLVAIYYNEADYEKAWELNSRLYELFPDNPSCLYIRGRILEKMEEWEGAEKIFRKLLARLTASEYNSMGYQIECHYRIALSLSKRERRQQALKECETALLLSKSYEPSLELEDLLGETKEILRGARKLRKHLSNGLNPAK